MVTNLVRRRGSAVILYSVLLLSLAGLSTFSPKGHAFEEGDIFIDPYVAVGSNLAQGTYYLLGLDAGFAVTRQVAFGVGAYYSMGQHPSDDREIGGGPFVMFMQPLASFLIVDVREDIDYIDERVPIQYMSSATGSSYWTHTSLTGVAAITRFGVHLRVTDGLGLLAGYRAVVSLANSDLGHDRSGFYFGISIGI